MQRRLFPLASQAVGIVNAVRNTRTRVATAAIFMAAVRRGRIQISLPVKGECASVEALRQIAGLDLVRLDNEQCTFVGDETTKKNLMKFSLDRKGFLIGVVSVT